METSLLLREFTASVEGKKFGIRAAAYIIDSLVYSIVSFGIQLTEGIVAGIAFYVLTGRELLIKEQDFQILSFIGGLVIFLIYFVMFEWLYGATPGKLILSMRVIKEDGTPCGLGAALGRGLLRFIDGFFFGLPAYFIMKAPLYQRGGDQVAKTLVVGSGDAIIRSRRAWWWFLIAGILYLLLDTIISMFLLLNALN